MRTHLTTAALAGVLGLALASPAVAQQVYPPASDGGAAVSATVVQPGQSFTFRAGGFRPFSRVTARLSRSPLALGSSVGPLRLSSASDETYTADADAEGVATFTLAVRGEGLVTVQAMGVDPSGAPRTVETTVTVTDDAGAPDGSSDADTPAPQDAADDAGDGSGDSDPDASADSTAADGTDEVAAPGGSALPRTGAGVLTTVALGVGFVVSGVVAQFVGRRRPARTAS